MQRSMKCFLTKRENSAWVCSQKVLEAKAVHEVQHFSVPSVLPAWPSSEKQACLQSRGFWKVLGPRLRSRSTECLVDQLDLRRKRTERAAVVGWLDFHDGLAQCLPVYGHSLCFLDPSLAPSPSLSLSLSLFLCLSLSLSISLFTGAHMHTHTNTNDPHMSGFVLYYVMYNPRTNTNFGILQGASYLCSEPAS